MCGPDDRPPTYPDGMAGLLAQMEGRRAPLTFAEGETLPPLTCDLKELVRTTVPPAEEDALRAVAAQSGNHRKFLDLRAELAGQSELCVLHGLLISHLRKRSQPEHCAALFHRLWAEESAHLLDALNPRWHVSAITTFGDHGLTPVQRQLGTALSILFGAMKLYESERRYSGHASDTAFPLDRRRHSPMPLEMDPYSIASGGLDVNMLGRLWAQAEEDAVIRPLAQHLLDQLIHDPHTIFRRLRTMRARINRRRALPDAPMRAAPAAEAAPPPDNIAPVPAQVVPRRRSGELRWGVTCTTDAPLPAIAAWAAHYLDLGADAVILHLDAPDDATRAVLGEHPDIEVVTCDAAYWSGAGKARPEARHRRQAFNATRALRASDLHFLGHVEVDEFLISPVPVARALDFVPPDMAQARVHPVELLVPLSGPPRHFKRAHGRAGQRRQVLEAIFPDFGAYLAGGFISHGAGKVFARCGLAETRLGVHRLKINGLAASNMTELPRMALAHCPLRDFTQFLERVEAYRSPPPEDMHADPERAALHSLLAFLEREEGEAGLRNFFDEVCTARPELLRALEERGMLLRHDLALEDKVARVFGTLPTPDPGAA